MPIVSYELLIQQFSKDNLLLASSIVKEVDRTLPATKTLDILDGALRNQNVKKIIVRKLSDYKEGDIF